MDRQASTSTPGDSSFNSSSGNGSIVLHSLSDDTSGSGIDSSFEALQINRTEESANDSSIEILVHSSPARTGFLATSTTAPLRTPHSRKPSLVVIDEKKELGILNPAAQAFAPVPPMNCTFETFEEIALYGKDALGDLTSLAKAALARLGLKSVPALHGPLNLPYARCASGIDAFVPTSDPEGEPWGEDEDENGVPNRQQRNLPIPLPGNARYTQAGRLAMRYSSAPAMLETGGKRFNRFPPFQRSPSQVLPNRQRKQNSPALAPPPQPSRPSPPSEQGPSATLLAVQDSKAQNQRNTAAHKPQRSQKSQQTTENQQAPRQEQQQQSQLEIEIQKQAAQFEVDAQAFAQAQAQAIQAYYYTQAQLAQAFGGQASQAEFVASQAAAGASAAAQRAGLAANAVLSATTPRSSFSGFSQAQSQTTNLYSPPSFPSVPNFASPPLVPQPLPSLSMQQQQQQQQQQNYVDYANQVDSLTLLKLAGQRQLGLSPFPIPLVNLPQQQSGSSAMPSSSRYSTFAANAENQNSFPSTSQLFEQEERMIDQDYNRQAVPFTTVGNSNASGGGTGYDFLRRASSHDRRGEHSRRDSSATVRLDREEERPTTLAKPPQVVRRRRSAAPAMPYPGHSLRKGSTSSVITVNSNLPRSAGIPQVRIFTDPPAPPASSSTRRDSTSNARCLEDLVNSQQQLSDNLNKTIRPSAAESSNNWRRPSLSLDETQLNAVTTRGPASPLAVVEPSQVEVPVVKAPATRGRGGGGGGRRKGRGGSKTRGQPAPSSNQTAS